MNTEDLGKAIAEEYANKEKVNWEASSELVLTPGIRSGLSRELYLYLTLWAEMKKLNGEPTAIWHLSDALKHVTFIEYIRLTTGETGFEDTPVEWLSEISNLNWDWISTGIRFWGNHDFMAQQMENDLQKRILMEQIRNVRDLATRNQPRAYAAAVATVGTSFRELYGIV